MSPQRRTNGRQRAPTRQPAKGLPPATGDRLLRLAHRGDWRIAPENSLEALVLATGIPGCDGVEFDVRLSRDGVPVLLHDRTLDRVQGRPDRVDELLASDLRAAGIPSLAEVLDALPVDAFLDVELKGEDHGRATANILREGRGAAPGRAAVSSFERETLAAMREQLPRWPRWLISDDLDAPTLEAAAGLGCRAVAVRWGAITPARLRTARASGLEVVAWTVRQVKTVERLERLGVFGCAVEGAALDG